MIVTSEVLSKGVNLAIWCAIRRLRFFYWCGKFAIRRFLFIPSNVRRKSLEIFI